jgi:hypothetical protein
MTNYARHCIGFLIGGVGLAASQLQPSLYADVICARSGLAPLARRQHLVLQGISNPLYFKQRTINVKCEDMVQKKACESLGVVDRG